MKTIYNPIIPVKGFSAINLCGVLFVRKGKILNKEVMNHENIHTSQIKEMCYIFFYIWYVSEWLIKLCIYGKKSYWNISFEREAYQNQANMNYLNKRSSFSWFRYV